MAYKWENLSYDDKLRIHYVVHVPRYRNVLGLILCSPIVYVRQLHSFVALFPYLLE